MQRDLLMDRRVYSGGRLTPSDQFGSLAVIVFGEHHSTVQFSLPVSEYWWCPSSAEAVWIWKSAFQDALPAPLSRARPPPIVPVQEVNHSC